MPNLKYTYMHARAFYARNNSLCGVQDLSPDGGTVDYGRVDCPWCHAVLEGRAKVTFETPEMIETKTWAQAARELADKADEEFAQTHGLVNVLKAVKTRILAAAADDGIRSLTWTPPTGLTDESQKRLARLVARKLVKEGFGVTMSMRENLSITWEGE